MNSFEGGARDETDECDGGAPHAASRLLPDDPCRIELDPAPVYAGAADVLIGFGRRATD